MKARLDEQQLVAQCAEGQREAQEELYKRYSRAMFNTCVRLLGFSEAKDMLQEVFTDVFLHINDFNGIGTLGSWIKRIAINKCLNELRRKKIQWIEIHDKEDMAEDEYEYEEQDIKAIYLAIEQLPDGYRQVFNLHVFEEMQHKDIAEVLGITESTSKTQYMKAKKRIRELLLNLKSIAE